MTDGFTQGYFFIFPPVIMLKYSRNNDQEAR